MKKFDIAIIGGGAAGSAAAKVARALGKSVALIDKDNRLGGECLWTGCVPSKALIRVAQIAYQAQHMQKLGLSNNPVDLDTDKVMDHVRTVVAQVAEKSRPELMRALGVDVMFGRAHVSDAHTLTINDETISATTMLIATGSSAIVPALDGLETVAYLTNQNLFDLKKIPASMIILGGGTIGVEMASAFNRLGCLVTIIEMQSRIIPNEDAELVDLLVEQMSAEGVRIRTDMKAMRVVKSENGVMLSCVDNADTGHTFEAEALLVAVGRKPNIEGLGLDEAGVRTTRRGITVDEMMRTTASNIYAAGDVAGPYQFSHMATHQAQIAAHNALSSSAKKKISYDDCVWVTFTAPEFATLGLTEQAARDQYGDAIQVYRKKYECIDRARIDGTERGMAKVICDKNGYILGAHILGERAGEMIHEFLLAKQLGKKFDYLHSMVHVYPTYSGLIWQMAKEATRSQLPDNILVQLCKQLFL